jgi:prepilin-type N-terminal cleavage/methylation domain-containing protein
MIFRSSFIRHRSSYRRGQRGFTMMEMLAVVAVIGILVAAATPMFLGVLRDRRANGDTLTIAEMYRLARNRSMGRGAATLVRYDEATSTWTMMEAILSGPATPPINNLPVSSCLGTDWAAGGNNRVISTFNGPADTVQVRFYDETDTARTDIDICFTPRGRTYIGPAGGPLATMSGVGTFTTQRLPVTDNQRVRTVFIAPNGAARIQL